MSLKAGDGREGLIATSNLGAVWDTVGWVYFKQGRYDKALPYLRASWLLTQSPEVGDHLGQLYPKLGSKMEAEQTFHLAYAATSQTPRTPHRDEVQEQIKKHYRDLTGKTLYEPVLSGTPPPKSAGPAAKSVIGDLSRMRESQFNTTVRASGSGTISIVFAPRKVESASLVDGDQALKLVTDDVRKAKFQVEFPDDAAVRLVRRGLLLCHGGGTCDVVLILPDDNSLAAVQ